MFLPEVDLTQEIDQLFYFIFFKYMGNKGHYKIVLYEN